MSKRKISRPVRVAFVCGSRATPQQQRKALWDALKQWHQRGTGTPIIMQGRCKDGPDQWADAWAQLTKVHQMPVAALWGAHQRGAGPIRNAIMRDILVVLRAGGARVTCFAMPYGKASGTRGMMALLEGAGFAVEVLDG